MIINFADFVKQREKIAYRNKRLLIKQIINRQILQYGFGDTKIAEKIVEKCRQRNILNSIYGIKRERSKTCHKY